LHIRVFKSGLNKDNSKA